MLKGNEIEILRKNARVHKKVFDVIRETVKEWTKASEIDELAGKIAKDHNVLCAFRWVYWYAYNIQTSINNVVVHGRPLKNIVFKNGDLVTFDFGIKDKQKWIFTDAAISLVVGGDDKNPKAAKLIKANKKALKAGIAQAIVGNRIWDISHAIESSVKEDGYHIVKELTWHAIGKKLHETPYVYNYGTPWTGPKIKEWMTLCIEPILWETTGQIYDEGNWEIYIADWSLWSQVEHLILITKNGPEIII